MKRSCVPIARALRREMRRNALRPRVRIGVRRDAGSLRAHAWLELGDLVLGEPGTTVTDYAVFERTLAQRQESRP